ncbi:hypothetical protein [Deinococcus sp.]|uniref:hypothetical protein n=1 Tax=Deinococcus sp. TaxID=47478 RepID=UPI0025C5E634|nr:hypothetical protein [Deinococcus sp.]
MIYDTLIGESELNRRLRVEDKHTTFEESRSLPESRPTVQVETTAPAGLTVGEMVRTPPSGVRTTGFVEGKEVGTGRPVIRFVGWNGHLNVFDLSEIQSAESRSAGSQTDGRESLRRLEQYDRDWD